ncbi:MAG: TonB-dependent receptor, partial [Saprospiraceae bacterium]|nr:TonB-dependent receptor [Saprospiraceae bacterium]
MKNFYILLLSCFCVAMQAQTTITGTVTDEQNAALIGASVLEKGTDRGTITDVDGSFSINVSSPNAILAISFTGFYSQEVALNGKTSLNVTLLEGVDLGEIQIVGSRSYKRSSTTSAVPVDVIDVAELTTQNSKLEINQMLQYAAPSFNANKQSGSDGADHIDPASLRGLGPDQTLVLINGKRRHQSSLINIFGTRGKGNTGTDLNAIPATAIKRIEILRDGASAQYGSDAIAGVINIVLKDRTEKLSGSVSYGAFNTNADGDFGTDPYGLWNTKGYRMDTEKDGNQIGEDQSFDGNSLKVAANYGTALGTKGGFINFTTEYISKEKVLRPGFEFRKGFGEAAIDGFNFFTNASFPVSDKTEIYAFGGRNFRDTDAFAFTRNNPTERNVVSIYPDGFTPRITSNIIDNSVSAGVRTKTNSDWNLDISNTYGKNNFHYFIKGTLNASLQEGSPTDFDAGGHSLSQNSTNLDLSKYFKGIGNGMNLAFGAESRLENFAIFAGEAGSYGTFDTAGVLITNPATQVIPTDPITGEQRPGGSQGFPGYSIANEVDRSRSSVALYGDAEFDITDAFLVSAAARFENFSDFGSTVNGKLAARLKAGDHFNIRGSASTGFRAPSLAQIYYNLRFTNFIAGVPFESLLSPNNSPVTASFGIGRLKQETATNAGLGFTASIGSFSATVDGYFIDIKDRIVLTGNFDATNIPNVESAQFFVNGVDTKTKGLDVVLSWRKSFTNDNNFSATLMGNFNDMEIASVNNKGLDEQTFFGEREKAFLLASAPASKIGLNLNYGANRFDVGLSFTRFSEIELLDYQAYEDPADYGSFENMIAAATDTYGAKVVTDLNIGIKFSDKLRLD